MAGFPLCSDCQREFASPHDRRFHAETIACPRCGPHIWFSRSSDEVRLFADAAIGAARALLREGKIVALRGLGGYQLLVDATQPEAVQRLRTRKRRAAKPLAIMVESLARVRSLFELSALEEQSLCSAAGPILLLRPRAGARLPAAIAPGLAEVGVMLPTTPLHALLAKEMPPLVATSGNIEGEPLSVEVAEAHADLAAIADAFLDHDRPIRRPLDDSVVRVAGGRVVTLRLARSLAPHVLHLGPLAVNAPARSLLAVGGEQKSAIAFWNGQLALLGPHVGDLGELKTRQRWGQQRDAFCELLGADAHGVAHDLHPDYFATRWAADSGLPALAVGHHHAHIAAGLIEHHWLDREVLGVAWDGTGWGEEGGIWGGECFRATAQRAERVACLRPFPLPGGEAAIHQPWRVALALLSAALGPDEAIRFLGRRGYRKPELEQVALLLARPHLTPLTSSMGRLFDAVAVMVLPLAEEFEGRAGYEGHFAMLLEAACSGAASPDAASPYAAYPLPIGAGPPAELDWRPLVAAVAREVDSGAPAALVAMRFHHALTQAIRALSDRHPDLPVVLGGGVFQNRVLIEFTLAALAPTGRAVGAPGLIPPGDGGLAAGQLAIALARLPNSSHPSSPLDD